MGCDDAEFGGGDRGDGRPVKRGHDGRDDDKQRPIGRTNVTDQRHSCSTLARTTSSMPPPSLMQAFGSPDTKLSTHLVSPDHHHRSWPASSRRSISNFIEYPHCRAEVEEEMPISTRWSCRDRWLSLSRARAFCSPASRSSVCWISRNRPFARPTTSALPTQANSPTHVSQ